MNRPGALKFWLAIFYTATGTGLGAVALTWLLEAVQRFMWGGTGADLLDAAEKTVAWRHIVFLLGAVVITGIGQLLLRRLSSGNGINTTAAIWFQPDGCPVFGL